MLLRVRIALATAELPSVLARDLGSARAHRQRALGAVEHFLDLPVGAVLLAAHREDEAVAGELELEPEVIEDVAELRIGAHLSPADAAHERGMISHRPAHHIELVDMLLNDVIAREPRVVEPVADLVLDIRTLRVGLDIPEASHVPVDAAGDDAADVAPLDAADRIDVALLVTALGAGHDLQLLGAAFGCALDEAAHARRVDRDRLLTEDMLALRGRLLEVDRAESRRRREDHDIGVGGAGLPVGVEAREHALRRHGLEAVLDQRVVGARRALLEEIRERHDLDRAARLLARRERVEHRAGSAATAADDGDLEHGTARKPRERAAGAKQDRRCRGSGDEGASVQVHRVLLTTCELLLANCYLLHAD